MDGIKDIYTAMQDRIKSPILGSIIIALILANWKLLYVIIIVKMSYPEKFEHFDTYMETSFWTSNHFWWPIVAGFLFAVAKPWIDVGGAWLYGKPIYIRKTMEAKKAIQLAKNKVAIEEEQVRIVELKLQQDRDLKKIQNEELREQTKVQIRHLNWSNDLQNLKQKEKLKKTEIIKLKAQLKNAHKDTLRQLDRHLIAEPKNKADRKFNEKIQQYKLEAENLFDKNQTT